MACRLRSGMRYQKPDSSDWARARCIAEDKVCSPHAAQRAAFSSGQFVLHMIGDICMCDPSLCVLISMRLLRPLLYMRCDYLKHDF